MLAQCSVFIATSLDGFISRENGDIDWLNSFNSLVPEGEDCGFKEFMDTIDVLVMGRNSFEKVLTFGEWPYGNKKVVILSKKGVSIPAKLKETVFSTTSSPSELVQELEKQGVKRIYVDGGLTIQSFISEGLISDITITLIPTILGAGKPLFGAVKNDVKLTLLKSKIYPFGFVQVTYAVNK